MGADVLVTQGDIYKIEPNKFGPHTLTRINLSFTQGCYLIQWVQSTISVTLVGECGNIIITTQAGCPNCLESELPCVPQFQGHVPDDLYTACELLLSPERFR